MRTTVTLDPDVEQMLRDSMRCTGKSFKATLNQALRKSLESSPRNVDKPFEINARPMGIRTGIDYGRLNQISDELEVEAFIETTRKIENSGASQS